MRSTVAPSLYGAYMRLPMQRADSGGWASLWIIKTEPAIACRCESGEWREGKITWTRCKVSVLVCDQAEHEVTLW